MPVIGNQIEVTLERIRLATDFSPSAETARLYAQALAHRYHSVLELLHVVDLSARVYSPDGGLGIEVCRRSESESLTRLAAQVASENLRVETLLCEAINPAKVILQTAEGKPIDLLVIGTRGHKGLARLVLGSTAEELIHRARYPILTIGPAVPPPQGPLCFQKIVYATDFSPEAAKAGAFALSFAQDCGAHLYLCHVAPGADSQVNEQVLNDRFVNALKNLVPDVASEWCEPECVVEHGAASDAILLLAQRVHADLIVLGTRKASHWFNTLKDGVACQVISASTCPVLTVRG